MSFSGLSRESLRVPVQLLDRYLHFRGVFEGTLQVFGPVPAVLIILNPAFLQRQHSLYHRRVQSGLGLH